MRYRSSHEFGVPLIMVSTMALVTHWMIKAQPFPRLDLQHRPISYPPGLAGMVWFEVGLLGLAWVLASCWLLRARANARIAAPNRRIGHPAWAWLAWLLPVLGWWVARGFVEHWWRVARGALPDGHPARDRYRARTGLWWGCWSAFWIGTVLVTELHPKVLAYLFPAWLPLGLLIPALELVALLAFARAVWALGQLHEALVAFQRHGYLRRYEAMPSLPGSSATLVMVYPPAVRPRRR